MSTSVKVFRNTDTGAPVLSSSAGTLIAVLDACLQDGYGNITLDSLVVASDVATATKSTGHGFTMLDNVGPVIRMAGATPAGLNGDVRITVTSSTQFTFTTTGISDQTATGTITAKRAPAGFTKAFSGTNLAAYRSDDVTGTRLYLRVDDTGNPAKTRGYEVMTDINTGTGDYPTVAQMENGVYTYKNYSSTWTLISDGKLFYFLTDLATYQGLLVFGDPISFKAGDAFHSVVCGARDDTINLFFSRTDSNGAIGCYVARSHSQLGTAQTFTRKAHVSQAARIGSAGALAYPNPVDNSATFCPVEWWDTALRGFMPGLYSQIHATIPPNNTVFTEVAGLDGHTLWLKSGYDFGGTCSYTFDITGPWR